MGRGLFQYCQKILKFIGGGLQSKKFKKCLTKFTEKNKEKRLLKIPHSNKKFKSLLTVYQDSQFELASFTLHQSYSLDRHERKKILIIYIELSR